MRRILLLIPIFALFLVPVTAQDEEGFEPVFEATEVFTVEDLGFQFFYPQGWVFDTSSGIALAETQSDLDALVADDSANIEGYTIQLGAFPVDIFELEDPTLDELVDNIVQLAGIEVDEIVEVPVMARRSISVIGSTPETGRGGIATIWLEDDFVVLFTFGVPDGTVDGNQGFTWGQILGSMMPMSDLEVTENLEAPEFGVAMDYPEDWIPIIDESGIRLYELASDAENDATDLVPEGLAIGMIFGTLDQVGVDASTTKDEIAEFIIAAFNIVSDDLSVEEFVIFENVPGVGVTGETDAGENVQVILFTDYETERILLYAVFLPTPEAFAEFENASLQILSSMRLLEE